MTHRMYETKYKRNNKKMSIGDPYKMHKKCKSTCVEKTNFF